MGDIALAAIKLDVDPMIDIGPLTLSWHGLATAVGLLVGSGVAVRYAKRRGLEADPLLAAVLSLALAGIVGARFVYLLENDAPALLQPGEWIGSRGFSFYGGMIFGTLAAAVRLHRERLGVGYLDAMAAGFPLGMALGRIGDLINGEHYGPTTDAPWAIRYTHPAAEVPSDAVGYHPGGLYEIVLALAIGLVVWALGERLRRPGRLLWTVIGLYGAGRFVMFFYRADSEPLALGLDVSQGLSLLMVLIPAAALTAGRHSALPNRVRRLPFAVGACALLIGAVVVVGGCAGGDEEKQGADDPVIEDPGPIHVHGLGINPADGALFIATHTGLFRAGENERKARRVGGRYQDTMASTVTGRDRFLGSGHPDPREKRPPFLGLVESRDAGRTWKPVSLPGLMDFHVLEVAGRRTYGFGTNYETRRARFLASTDGGKSWYEREIPEAFASVAIRPGDGRRLVAAGRKRLHASEDAGRSWRALRGPAGLLAWTRPEELYVVQPDGTVSLSVDAGRGWQAVGRIGGAPAAFEAGPRGLLLAALHDGTIKQSRDGGTSWAVRSAP